MFAQYFKSKVRDSSDILNLADEPQKLSTVKTFSCVPSKRSTTPSPPATNKNIKENILKENNKSFHVIDKNEIDKNTLKLKMKPLAQIKKEKENKSSFKSK